MRCLLGECKIREEGGCYCLCRLFDKLDDCISIQNGKIIPINGGSIYCPDPEEIKKRIEQISDQEKVIYQEYLEKLPGMIISLENKIKEYELK
jgi:hypothetical protein